MGQSSSQEVQASTNGEPEPPVLHKSTEKSARKRPTPTTNAIITKDATQLKEVDMKIDGTSEDDEDDESDWSDWDAKASRSAKRSPTPEVDLGQSTYDTTSDAEREDGSDGKDQQSRTNKSPPGREGLQEFGYIKSPAYSPSQVEDKDAKEDNGNEGLRSPALNSASGDDNVFLSGEKSDCLEGSDSEASAGTLESVEYLQVVPVRRPRAQKKRQTPNEQPLRSEGATESDSLKPRYATQHDKKMAPANTTASDQEASSPSSIFDTLQDSALLDSDRVQNPTRKRKRRSAGESASGAGEQPTRKRRRRSIFSPPTSVSTEEEEVSRDPSPGLKAIQGRFKINRPVIQTKSTYDQVGQDQGSVATWAKPLALDSSLKHPIFNPSPLKNPTLAREADLTGQKEEPSVRSTSAAPRRTAKKPDRRIGNIATTVEDPSNDEGRNVRKKSRKVFSSPKGKSKAKPGVEYSSPPNARTRTTRLNSNIKSGGKRRPKLSKISVSGNLSEDNLEQQNLDGSEPDSDVNLSEAETEESVEDSAAPKEMACKTCNRRFRLEKQLRTHQKNNRAHTKSYECSKCQEEFKTKNLLLRHQSLETHPRETFHTRRTGPFSDIEKQKLELFMMDYCDDHGIDETVFRQMMTDSSRRGQGAPWPWPGVTRFAFLNEYFDVLPDRERKSMQRYKERYFQNLDHNKEWTKDDDKLLIVLVNELGPKWIEIGLRLNRTQDSVTQRYKKKLKNGDAAQSGPWSSRESNALEKAINGIKDELGLAQTTDTDEKISWSEVSNRMGGIRTGPQCSTHWRRVHRREHKPRAQSARLGRKVKSKEFVSSDSDEDQGDVTDDGRRERPSDVVINKNPTMKSSHAMPNYSSEFDSRNSENDQNVDDDEDRSDAAAQARPSPELGSSDHDERNSAPSPTDTQANAFTDPADRDDTLSESVVATAGEWEKILEAEGQPLPPLATVDIEDGIYVSQRTETGENSPVMSATRMKGPTANSKGSRNPFSRKTPGRVMALTQIFNDTQAPTSVLRQLTPNSVEISASYSSRPSPDIRLKPRPDMSQDLGTSQLQGVRRKLDLGAETKIAHGTEMEGFDDNGGESDEDVEMEDANKAKRGSESPSWTSASVSASQESGSEFSEQEEQVSDRPAFSSVAINEESGAMVEGDSDTSEGDDASAGNVESEEDYMSSGGPSKSGDESAVAGGSDDDDGNDGENDSMVKDTHNDFMANIKESAKYMSQWTPVAARRITGESDDDSD